MQSFNEMNLTILAKSENESFARSTVAAFAALCDPTLSDIADIKTAVSEAVSNSVIHGYENKSGEIHINCKTEDGVLTIKIKDCGQGIEDIEKAREPLYTSKPELERSGMGFTVMETFMDSIEIRSKAGDGTEITMTKALNAAKSQ